MGSSGLETSRDWGNEFVESLKWLGIAFTATAVGFTIVVALLLTLTKWGRQFWSVSGGYFRGPGAWRTLLFVGALLFMTLVVVRLNVLLSYWGNDMFSSLQAGGSAFAAGDSAALDQAEDAFWKSMIVFTVLIVVWIVNQLVNLYASMAFDIRWRVWLTEHVTTDWLRDRAFYRSRFIDNTIDNPDQRVQQDITTFVNQSRVLSLGAVEAVVSIVSFTKILWDLSGPMTLLGVTIPRDAVFLVLIYVLGTTFIAFWIGRPLIRINFLLERMTANFRYALVRVRDSAESVAFYRGEGAERRGLLARFAEVIRVQWKYVFRYLKFQGWNFTVTQAAVIFPYLIQAPRFFDGAVSLGGVNQTVTAFGNIHDSLSFFRNAYDEFAAYRAALIRIDGLLVAGDDSRELPEIDAADLAEGVRLDKVDVRKPDGHVLIDDLSLALSPGEALVVKGPSGSGKTTLLRALAQMWPYADGRIERPAGDDTLFLSQIPYLPLGDLRVAAEYPGKPEDISDDRLRAVLEKVHLGHLVDRLDEEADWAKILSPGEQQRLAFGRILLLKPKVVFLDEATSAVDEGLEYSLYKLVRTELPETIVVSVAHRSTVDQHHTQKLELQGDGPWTLQPVAVTA
ncbi:ABC transporter ATP-binding protein/permease [Nocardia farcinica]|uniref:ABC transporter ATP-binding protein/permease n=1 Tax=Nocardia farcinica TaxID=37329 RepID=UPI0022B9ED21|nr:ABC transporter ATP-binding protein/permease [Nocardia farcinica]MCZ9327847.1 ABC transporter ATP-binding protein/permease [Nocardia farcinica]